MKKLVELIAEQNYNEAGKILNEMTAKKLVSIISSKKENYVNSVKVKHSGKGE